MLAELEKACEAVHLLQESTFPDHCPAIRDHIFGRGINKTNLFEHFNGQLVKEWIPKMQRCEKVLADFAGTCITAVGAAGAQLQIELGVYEPSRRMFTGTAADKQVAAGMGRGDEKGRGGGKRHPMPVSVAVFDGENVNDPSLGLAMGSPSPPSSPRGRTLAGAGSDNRMSLRDRKLANAHLITDPLNPASYQTGGRARSVSPPSPLTGAQRLQTIEGGFLEGESLLKVQRAHMSPRLAQNASPRSYDPFSNLPQFSGDSKGTKVIDSDMEVDYAEHSSKDSNIKDARDSEGRPVKVPGQRGGAMGSSTDRELVQEEDQSANFVLGGSGPHSPSRQIVQDAPRPTAKAGFRGASTNFSSLAKVQIGESGKVSIMAGTPGGPALSSTASPLSIIGQRDPNAPQDLGPAGKHKTLQGKKGTLSSYNFADEFYSIDPSNRYSAGANAAKKGARSAPGGSLFGLGATEPELHPRAGGQMVLQQILGGPDPDIQGAGWTRMTGGSPTGWQGRTKCWHKLRKNASTHMLTTSTLPILRKKIDLFYRSATCREADPHLKVDMIDAMSGGEHELFLDKRSSLSLVVSRSFLFLSRWSRGSPSLIDSRAEQFVRSSPARERSRHT